MTSNVERSPGLSERTASRLRGDPINFFAQEYVAIAIPQKSCKLTKLGDTLVRPGSRSDHVYGPRSVQASSTDAHVVAYGLETRSGVFEKCV